MNKQKLIDQYNQKIKNCDILLEAVKNSKRKLRHRGNDNESLKIELSKDFHISSAQRQCYIQIVSDLEYELDSTECILYVDPEKSCQALILRKNELG